jgi:uncharacterized protein YjbJ (UPF0337 family)
LIGRFSTVSRIGTFQSATGCSGSNDGFARSGVMAMNWDRIEGNWEQFKGKVQQKWGHLTDDDLEVVEGRRKELAGRIQQRYGMAKDEAERQIDDWLKTIN